jgi:hypothetical protein
MVQQRVVAGPNEVVHAKVIAATQRCKGLAGTKLGLDEHFTPT